MRKTSTRHTGEHAAPVSRQKQMILDYWRVGERWVPTLSQDMYLLSFKYVILPNTEKSSDQLIEEL